MCGDKYSDALEIVLLGDPACSVVCERRREFMDTYGQDYIDVLKEACTRAYAMDQMVERALEGD